MTEENQTANSSMNEEIAQLLLGDDVDVHDDTAPEIQHTRPLEETQYERQHADDVEPDISDAAAELKGEIPETQAGIEPQAAAEALPLNPRAMQQLEQVQAGAAQLNAAMAEIQQAYQTGNITQQEMQTAQANSQQYGLELQQQALTLREQALANTQRANTFTQETNTLIPGYADPKKGPAIQKDLLEFYMEQTGSTPEEAMQAGKQMSPKQLKFIHNAMKLARRPDFETERALKAMEAKAKQAKQAKLAKAKETPAPKHVDGAGNVRRGSPEAQIDAVAKLLMG